LFLVIVLFSSVAITIALLPELSNIFFQHQA